MLLHVIPFKYNNVMASVLEFLLLVNSFFLI